MKVRATLILLVLCSPALAKKPQKPSPPPSPGTLNGGATLWANLRGDTTASWGAYSPGTTPTSKFLADEGSIVSLAQGLFAGNNVDDGLPHAPLNIHVIADHSGALNAGTTKVTGGGSGDWISPTHQVGGIAYMGTIFGGGSKAFVFTDLFTYVRDVVVAFVHEFFHTLGVPHTPTSDEKPTLHYVMDAAGGGYGTDHPVFTLTEWRYVESVVGDAPVTVPSVPEPSILWLLSLGILAKRKHT